MQICKQSYFLADWKEVEKTLNCNDRSIVDHPLYQCGAATEEDSSSVFRWPGYFMYLLMFSERGRTLNL